LIGKTISGLNIKEHRHALLLAIKTDDRWIYNPPHDYVFRSENMLILVATPEGRLDVERILGSN
jgi:uncharacterized protein with PhoU and TrkA domain